MKAIIAFINSSRTLLYCNVILCFFLLNGVASAWNCRFDLSRDRLNSLSSSSARVIGGLKDPVLVEAYITTDLPGELKSMLNPILAQLDEIGRLGGKKIKLRIINPTEEKMQQAEQRGIQGIPIEQSKVDEISQKLGYFGVYIQYGDKSAILNLVDDGRIVEDFEYRFLKEIRQLSRKEGPSGLGFVKVAGSAETRRWQNYQDQDKDNLYGFRLLLEKDFGSVADVPLTGPIDPNVETLLLIGQPRLDDRQAYYIDQFIMRGGNLICMLKGFDFQLQEQDPRMAKYGIGGQGGGFASVQREDLDRLNQFLKKYGISVRGEILFEPELAAPEMDIQGQFVQKVRNPAWAVYSRESDNIIADLPAIRNVQQVIFPWYSGLDISEQTQPNVNFTKLIVSSPDAVSKDSSPIGLREMQKIGDRNDPRVGKAVPVAVLAQGKFQSGFSSNEIPKGEDKAAYRSSQSGSSQSTIFVIGSPYLVSDVLLKNEPNLQIFKINQAFIMNLLEASQGDTDLAAARSRIVGLDQLKPFSRDPGRQKFVERIFSWFHILFLPTILGIYGARRLVRRNQRRGIEKGAAAK